MLHKTPPSPILAVNSPSAAPTTPWAQASIPCLGVAGALSMTRPCRSLRTAPLHTGAATAASCPLRRTGTAALQVLPGTACPFPASKQAKSPKISVRKKTRMSRPLTSANTRSRAGTAQCAGSIPGAFWRPSQTSTASPPHCPMTPPTT